MGARSPMPYSLRPQARCNGPNPAQLADLIERYGDQVRTVALDVTNEQEAVHAVAVATKAFGRLDVLVNNAGYGDISPIEDTSLDEFHAEIETNPSA